MNPISASSAKDSFPSVGLGAYNNTGIPPSRPPRTLILCFDATGYESVTDNSNLIQFYSMLQKGDRNQVIYYQAGIGTYTVASIMAPPGAKWKRTVDKAIANLIDIHIMGGYEFLMEQYHPGDKICLFGYSRGACTAVALAGMINKVGLLPAGHRQQISSAYKLYTRDDEMGWVESIGFKKTFSMDVEIEFVGVWDTICSSRLIPYILPSAQSNTSLRNFRNALSLDERRSKFQANHWHLLANSKQKGTRLGEMLRSNGPSATNVREVWFAGCHSDVGGGPEGIDARNCLARIPLRWMIRECLRANTAIQFHRESLKNIGLDPDTFLDPRPPAIAPTPALVAQVAAQIEAAVHAHKPTSGTLVDYVQASSSVASSFKSEENEELADALSPICDQLKLSKIWWILEFLPTPHRQYDQRDYSLNYKWRLNLGRGRKVPVPVSDRGEKVLVHRSVKTRMEAEGLPGGKYEPKAKFQHLDHEWVD